MVRGEVEAGESISWPAYPSTATMKAPVLDKAEGEDSHPGLSSDRHTCSMAHAHPHSHRGTKDQNREAS